MAPAGAAGTRPGPKPGNLVLAYDSTAPSTPGAVSSIWVMTGTGRDRREVSQTPAGAADTRPSLSLASGVMVWQRTVGGATQLFGGDVFNDPPHQMTDFPGGVTDPSLSRNVEVVASVHSGNDCELWVLDWGNDVTAADVVPLEQRRLTDHGGGPGCDATPAWSLDGRRVVFRRITRDATGAIVDRPMVVPATGGTPTPLSAITEPFTAFGWTPGRQLLLLTAPSPQLVAVDPAGTHRRVLASDAGLTGVPSWAPLADWAAGVRRQADGSTDIVTVDGDGGALKNISRTPGVSEGHPSPAYPSNQGNGVGPGVHAHSLPARRHGRRKRRTRAVVAATAASRGALYVGRTNQRPRRYGPQRLLDNEVSFRVRGGKIREFAIPWVIRCLDDYHGALDAPLIDYSGFDALPLRAGRFAIRNGGYSTSPGFSQKADIKLVLKGVVRGRTASGTLAVQASITVDKAYIADHCGSDLRPRFGNRPIRWRATLRR